MTCSALDGNTMMEKSATDWNTSSNYSAPCETQSEMMATNYTENGITSACETRPLDATTVVFLTIYSAIFIAGIIGNALVIIVILKYQHLKTVTNVYILSLSIADSMFLLVLPLTITVAIAEHWIFGGVMCKLFYTLDCINKFMSAFILTIMAGDRYLAACHPINSLSYRKRKYSAILLVCIWMFAFIIMSPAIYYASLLPKCSGTYSCIVLWPNVTYSNVFTAYSLILAFVIPVICICTFYAMIIARLRHSGPGSLPHRRHCQFRKATRLVTVVICVFIGCWLPYWCMQVVILLTYSPMMFRFYQVFTALSYANSMLNPLLYGFTNEYFREAFNSVFYCRSANVVSTSPKAGACGGSANICEQLEGACDENQHKKKEWLHLRTLPSIQCESTNLTNLEIEEMDD